ncbi:hypothetical protein IM807_01230 [Mycoplasma sp. 'Moose RK']|nr:hypothetical protein [Mycoplasma sp. 'Moose RK']
MKILIKNPVGKDLEKWKAAKKRLYEYRFTSNNQMAMFKEKFPKNPITEKQAGYLYDFWENNYAHFYPSMARSSTSRKNWRNELQKILNIVKDPEVGAFNRVSGGHVFIFDPKTNNNQWLDPQVQNSPTLKKK